MRNIFEKANKEKIRFEYKGTITAEDLWDLDVTELDIIYKALCAEKRELSEDSLLGVPAKDNTLLNTKIKIVTQIVEDKLAEKEARELAVERKQKKEKIMAILESKQDSALEKKSAAQLQRMLDEL